jgi:hypothetical protein
MHPEDPPGNLDVALLVWTAVAMILMTVLLVYKP